jgi:hypothetical protein
MPQVSHHFWIRSIHHKTSLLLPLLLSFFQTSSYAFASSLLCHHHLRQNQARPRGLGYSDVHPLPPKHRCFVQWMLPQRLLQLQGNV